MADFDSLSGAMPMIQPGSSPAAQGSFAVQSELLRRAARDREAKRYQDEQAMKQAAAAQLARMQDAQIEEHASTGDANRAYKLAQEQALKDSVNEKQLNRLTGSLRLGQGNATKADYDRYAALTSPDEAARVFETTNTPAVAGQAEQVIPGEPGGDDASENPAGTSARTVPAVLATPASTSYEYKGDNKQRALTAQEEFNKATLAGDYDTGDVAHDTAAKEAAANALGGRRNVPAARTPAETAQMAEQRIENMEVQKAQGTKLTPAQESEIAIYRDRHPTETMRDTRRMGEATVAADRAARAAMLATVVQAQGKFADHVLASWEKGSAEMDRADRALYVAGQTGFAADSVLSPEFLQVMAGGMGSGLRMTESELKRVGESQSILNQWAGKFNKYLASADGPGKDAAAADLQHQWTISPSMRAEMKKLLKAVSDVRHRQQQEKIDAIAMLDPSMNPVQFNQFKADYMSRETRSGIYNPALADGYKLLPTDGKPNGKPSGSSSGWTVTPAKS